ncbi:thioredoxin family protein [Paenibacillus timonensis]|uniref:Thioredoxin family protein n=1 Tax=Paenibacillus timonensis TaxID=225915 RepID=A0ABW3SBW5_9BACL|nr:thioredoxin family protein [Paenibacillus timonensis]MCH1640233.1 thioredoxin family protein [Paenibacillus timonensis]
MPLREITEQEWLERMEKRMETEQAERATGREALFFVTALCGTCQLAEKMLEIVLASGPCIPVSKLNINYTPRLRERWQIASVPCLVVLQDGEPVRQEYAMRSVVDLSEWLRA